MPILHVDVLYERASIQCVITPLCNVCNVCNIVGDIGAANRSSTFLICILHGNTHSVRHSRWSQASSFVAGPVKSHKSVVHGTSAFSGVLRWDRCVWDQWNMLRTANFVQVTSPADQCRYLVKGEEGVLRWIHMMGQIHHSFKPTQHVSSFLGRGL